MSLRSPELCLLTCSLVLALGAGCRREERRFSESPSSSLVTPKAPTRTTNDLSALQSYADNAWAVSEGQRLFSQMNCVGCHSHGGGGIGPPLMDAPWRYGSDLQSIEQSILQGRPRGMPAFASKITRQQAWELVAYVRSLGGHTRSDAAPVRDDHMAVRPPPSRTDALRPVVEKVD